MGGDKGPAEVVRGAANALKDIGPSDTLILVGEEKSLNTFAQKAGILGNPRIAIRNASDVINMDDKPMQALKSKKDASMLVALDMVKSGEADAMFTTGNTKVLVGAGTVKLRPMAGVDRPALAAILPHMTGHFVLMDVGANPESAPVNLLHNAVMGSLYAQAALGLEKPRLGLLTVGTEEGKGGDRINRAHAMLKKLGTQINYIGPVEGFDIFDGGLDVVIVDGFTGNILLKSLEGILYMLQGLVKENAGYNPLYWVGGLALLPILSRMKHHLKPEQNGGAPLLGLSALVMKAHASSNHRAIRGAIRLGREALSHNLSVRLREAIACANALVSTPAATPENKE
jgi:glycerol-3-phosphate acyltransferase PlsX